MVVSWRWDPLGGWNNEGWKKWTRYQPENIRIRRSGRRKFWICNVFHPLNDERKETNFLSKWILSTIKQSMAVFFDLLSGHFQRILETRRGNTSHYVNSSLNINSIQITAHYKLFPQRNKQFSTIKPIDIYSILPNVSNLFMKTLKIINLPKWTF